MDMLRNLYLLPWTGFLLMLSACANVPEDFEQVSSTAWPEPGKSTLGRFFAQDATDGRGLSGVFLLDDPHAALRARLGPASLAEKTLDLQYYIWKGDTAGGLLLHRAHRISRIAWWICVALIYFGPNWILWAVLLRFLGGRHPPTLNDNLPVGRSRELVGALSLVVFLICFVPNPIVFSWSDFFEAVGLAAYLPG